MVGRFGRLREKRKLKVNIAETRTEWRETWRKPISTTFELGTFYLVIVATFLSPIGFSNRADRGGEFQLFPVEVEDIVIKSTISIFYIFVHNNSFLKVSPNFNLLRSLEPAFLDFISDNLRRH